MGKRIQDFLRNLKKRYDILSIANRLILIILGSVVAAVGFSLFQVPFTLAAGGVSGIGIIVNHFSGLPIGITILLLNIPLLIIGFYKLGRWYFIFSTVISVIIFSVATDICINFFLPILKGHPITDDMLLSAIYAGLIGGVGGGIIFRAGGTLGGTNIIGKLIHKRFGIPMSQCYLFSDGFVILFAAFVFGWNIALHAFLTIFLIGLATDYVFEGPSVIRIGTVITDKPDEITQILMKMLNKGVSRWEIVGAYTGKKHHMIYCAIYRSQANMFKQVIAKTDPKAFVVIGEGRQALGEGFIPWGKISQTQ